MTLQTKTYFVVTSVFNNNPLDPDAYRFSTIENANHRLKLLEPNEEGQIWKLTVTAEKFS